MQVIAELLQPEDALTARLVCHSWAQDLGSFVPVAKFLPAHRLSDSTRAVQAAATAGIGSASAVGASNAAAAVEEGAGTSGSTATNSHQTTETGTSVQSNAISQQHAGPAAVRNLLTAFPHCQTVHVDVCNAQPERLAAVLNTLAALTVGGNKDAVIAAATTATQAADEDEDCKTGSCCQDSGTAAADVDDADASSGEAAVIVQQAPALQLQRQGVQVPQVCLDAVPRSFHCRARQDCPCAPAGEVTLHQPTQALSVHCLPCSWWKLPVCVYHAIDRVGYLIPRL